MNTDKAAFNAGETKGQTQEKASNLTTQAGNALNNAKDSVQPEKPSNLTTQAGNAFNNAKESAQQAGAYIAASAQGATEAVKNATGLNK